MPVGRKVSIVSDHPQTTRRRITGVVTLEDCRIVLLDPPGFQKPFDSLTRRMQTTVDDALEEVDAALSSSTPRRRSDRATASSRRRSPPPACPPSWC